MNRQDCCSFGQLLALCSAAALTPALRMIPSLSAAQAGRSAWLAVLSALPAALLYAAFLWRFGQRRRAGESMAALWQRAAGRGPGRILLLVFGLWLLFYAAFTPRSGAERLIGTVYPRADRRALILPLGLASAAAGSGELRRLARTAKLVLPLLIGAIALTLVFSLPELDADNLLPLVPDDAAALLRGALPTLDVAGLVLTLLFFLSDSLTGEPRFRSTALRILRVGTLTAAITAAAVGAFGHELTARLAQPYFALVRSLVLFRSLERPEALLVALWIFSDFLLTAALILAARRSLAPLFGPLEPQTRFLGLPPLLLACFLAPEAEAFSALSLHLVPAINAAVCLLLIPGVFALGRLRKKF